MNKINEMPFLRAAMWLFAVIVLLPFSGMAQQTAQKKVISLNDAVQMGVTSSKQLKVSAAKINLAKAKLAETKDYGLPMVKLSAAYTRESDIQPFMFQFSPNTPPVALFPVILNNYSAVASADQEIFTGFKLKYGLQAQQYLEQAAELDQAKDKLSVEFNVINAYYNIYKIEVSEKLVESNLKLIAQHLKEVKDFQKHGLATNNDVLKVELQQSNIKLSQIDLKNNLKIAKYDFGIMLGIPDSTVFSIDTSSVYAAKVANPLNVYQQKAANNRNELKEMDLRLKAEQDNEKVAKSDMYPHLGVGANYYYMNPNPRYIPPEATFHGTWDAGVHLTYNLSALYTTKHKLDKVAAQTAETQAARDQMSDAVKMQVNQSYVQYNQALQKIKVMQQSVKQAKENYKFTKSRYDNHVALLTDLLDANVAMLKSEISLATAKADASIAYNKLLKASGMLTVGTK